MEKRYKKAVSLEAFIFLVIFLLIFGGIAMKMGGANMMQTLMATAYELLIDTVFNIMAIAVIAGALSGVLSEFGVIALLNKAITPLMKPLYNLPGAASVGIMTTYLSDNPAILGLAEDRNFRRYFKKFQLPALTTLGTAFGMGLIILAMILHIVNALRSHDVENAWFDANGMAGLVFYASAVATIVLFMTGHKTPAGIVLAVMFGIPLLLILFKEPLTRTWSGDCKELCRITARHSADLHGSRFV